MTENSKTTAMEQALLYIIDDKAKARLSKMSESKAKSYKMMLYAGVRVTLDDITLQQVASEIGYASKSSISKLIHRWNDKITEGDVTIHRIISAYNKLQKRKFRVPRKIASQNDAEGSGIDALTKEENKQVINSDNVRSHKSRLGFQFTAEDDLMECAARRSAILFMQNYGKGRQPRMDGEYYSPGENPNKPSDSTEWLPLDTAAMYCGCKSSILEKAGQSGGVRRRVYKNNKNKNYYEYLVSDLDLFIKKNGMI